MLNHVARPVVGTRLPAFVFETHGDLARYAASMIAALIRERTELGQRTVLGLPTGSTPVGTYRELVRLHQQDQLDFSRVVIFGIDEYYGLPSESPQSHRRWLTEHFLSQVNIHQDHIHFLDSQVHASDVEVHCRRFEESIQHFGGFDLVLLGIGRNGHIGFNEPFSSRRSKTRLVTLDPMTRISAASDFFGEDNVPNQALTVGMGSILAAKRIVLLALGEHKAHIIRDTLEQPASERVPASALQDHGDAKVLIDGPASAELTGTATPWLLGSVVWDDALVKRAVLWLCHKTGKALLKLDDEDFRKNNLHSLLRYQGRAHQIAQRVFRWMMETIEHHPAGCNTVKTVLCFSPHPDDDVISMGGTLIRLVEDNQNVHIAYMTSGNIAVFDHDARRVADLVCEYNRIFEIDHQKSLDIEQQVEQSLASKQPGQPDPEVVLAIKSLIRWSEARAGAITVGCREENLHFLDLPFYRTGTIAKKPVGEEDIQIILELLQKVSPDQVYVAGDLADPHGTHRVCAEAIFMALEQYRQSGSKNPEVLLYRGAWQEYPLHEIDIAVPLSPSDILRKREAIFMHESQKDEALFPGSDPREFWQRAEDRNRGTAESYNLLGLPEYFALEAFARWDGEPL
ncbi:MAG: glucosamine-6-phosphate deaminase [Pirellulaceae bacterium]|jgi:glucosamine-6-phosphate deaminase